VCFSLSIGLRFLPLGCCCHGVLIRSLSNFRLRLREEVDILKHLSQASLTQYVDGRHPNVLAYIDSWEEDECLFIRTELCESGNLARFLWEYGRVFPRLDEARVWKIIVDLSNVCHAINLLFGSPIHRG